MHNSDEDCRRNQLRTQVSNHAFVRCQTQRIHLRKLPSTPFIASYKRNDERKRKITHTSEAH